MKRCILIIIVIFVCTSPSRAQGEGSAFFAFPFIVDESAKDWDHGYRFGVSGWYTVAKTIQIGGLFSTNYWNSGGELLAIELYPSIRVNRIFGDINGMDFFVQLGGGYTFIDGVSAPMFAAACTDCTTISQPSNNMIDYGGLGFNIGLGYRTRTGSQLDLEILPMYHIGFAGDDINSFVSLNIGLLFE